jgi:glycosyltransferase involved in cell wall biosynthesis
MEDAGLAKWCRIDVIGSGSSNGVDTNRFQPPTEDQRLMSRASLGVNPGEVVIGFVGRLHADKGLQLLVDAVSNLARDDPRIRLLLVGNAESAYAEELLADVDKYSPLIIHKPFGDPVAAYHAMDIFCLPSVREGFPNVVLEASACGLPVITTRNTGCRDAILEHRTGLFFDSNDSMSLANALEVLADSLDLRKSLGTQGRLWVHDNFRQEVVWPALFTYFDSHVANNSH